MFEIVIRSYTHPHIPIMSTRCPLTTCDHLNVSTVTNITNV